MATPMSTVADPNHPSGSHPRIFISAAEHSGDQHAAGVIRALRAKLPQTTFTGIAGPRMRLAGCEAVADLTDRSAMLLGAVGLAGHVWRLLRRLSRTWAETPPDLAILVDSPALHLPMAKRLKAVGCPVLYYIAPQLWAWAPWRIARVRRRVDRMAVILPFEEGYFRPRGLDARFVGHPLVEQLQARAPSPQEVESIKSRGSPLVACLPGSRRHVVREVLPGQIEVARAIAAAYPGAAFVFAAAGEAVANMIREKLAGETLRSTVEVDRSGEVLSAADLALCASGTATLTVAWYRVPMVVMYNHSKWGYKLVGRWLIRTPHLCLVNILAGRRIVPEFMPFYASTDPIAREALDLLVNEERRSTMKTDLDALIQSLGNASASTRTAEIACEMLRAAPARTS